MRNEPTNTQSGPKDFVPGMKLISILFDRSVCIFAVTHIKQRIDYLILRCEIQLDHLAKLNIMYVQGPAAPCEHGWVDLFV